MQVRPELPYKVNKKLIILIFYLLYIQHRLVRTIGGINRMSKNKTLIGCIITLCLTFGIIALPAIAYGNNLTTQNKITAKSTPDVKK